MQGNYSKRTGALSARAFAALWAFLVLAAVLGARPTAAAPFAYVANKGSNTVTVIDTAANPPAVVTTVPVGTIPVGSPPPRMGHTSMWRILAPTPSR
jgi:YVTN family beta-propeller protein